MSHNSPLVTIITPSFNQGRFIERTILSVLKQDYPRIEYILMDALSSDETHSILNKYRHQITKVVRAKDRGQSDAVNKGYAMSNGSIMAYLNSDDCYADAGVVSRAVKLLMADSLTDCVYGQRQIIDEDGLFVRTVPYREFDEEAIFRACFIWQESCFWTRNIYEKAGGYVCDQNQFALDYEMWLRFLKHGAKFKAAKGVYGLFRQHSTSKSVATWLDVGFFEAQAMQVKYCGKGNSLAEMYENCDQHINGVNERKYPRATLLNEALWKQHSEFGQTVLKAPMDYWVYRDFV